MEVELQELPQDVRYHEILSQLDPTSLLNYCAVNKKANKTCNDPQFWEIYLKHTNHHRWEDLLKEIAYNGNLSLFLYIYEKGTILNHITDLPDLETCYYYFIEQNFSEGQLEKIRTVIISLNSFTLVSYGYTAIKMCISKLKRELLPMFEAWNKPGDIWVNYLTILLTYRTISPFLSEEYVGDFILWNTSHIDYVKFLSLDLYGEEWEDTVKANRHPHIYLPFKVRDSLIKALLRNGYTEIVKRAITRIRELIRVTEYGRDLARELDVALARESTLEDFKTLGGTLKSFRVDLPLPVRHEDMFKAIAKAYPQYIVKGYTAMTPQEWLDFFIERTHSSTDLYKRNKLTDAIYYAKQDGYYHWSISIKESPTYKNLTSNL